jgi:hypothetical protein
MPFDLQSRSRHGINYTYPQLFPVSSADVHSGLVDEVQMTSLMGGCKANCAGRTKSIGRSAFYKQTDTIHHFLATPASSDNNQLETCRKSSLLTGSIPTPVSINFTYIHKVVPKSVVNPDCLKPLNCKGLFTTTHARTNRSSRRPLVMANDGRQAVCSRKLNRVGLDRLPDRNPESGLIGIGLASGLRTLSQSNNKNSFIHKVVPKSVVNPDCLKPLNCKGLFTTTHAKTHRPLISPILMKFGGHQATCSIQSNKVHFDRLPDRNLEPGLIGIGLASGLRTLFYEN